MEILIAVAVSITTGIFLVEGYVWLDSLAAWLLERAVRHIVDDEQARCREEWSSDLAAMPNSLFKIAYAMANFRKSTAEVINAEYVAYVLAEFDELIFNSSTQYQFVHYKLETVRPRIDEGDSVQLARVEKAVEKMGTLISEMTSLRDHVKETAQHLRSTAATKAWVKELSGSLDEFGDPRELLSDLEAVKLDNPNVNQRTSVATKSAR
jgi:hypothetical protein